MGAANRRSSLLSRLVTGVAVAPVALIFLAAAGLLIFAFGGMFLLLAVAADRCSDLDLIVIQDTPLPFLERSRAIVKHVKPEVAVDLLVYMPAEFEEIREAERITPGCCGPAPPVAGRGRGGRRR